MATDLSISSAEQLLALVNVENETALTLDHIQFDVPVTLENDPDNKNTALVVQSRPNGGYVGDVEIKYDRLDLSGFTQYGEPQLIIPPNGTVDDIIASFNAFYDSALSLTDDVKSDITTTDIDYVGKEIVLEATASSFAYQGTIVVSVKWKSTELAEAISVGMLTGLTYPIPMGEKLIGAVELLPNLPSASRASINVVLNDILYIIGGVTASNINDVLRYDLINDAFLPNAADFPRVISYGHVAAINNKIYVYGGSSGSTRLDSMYQYNPDTDTWSNLGLSGYGARIRGGYCTIGDNFYIGAGTDTNVYISNELLVYNAVTNEWSVKPLPVSGISYPAMTSIEDTIYFMGGRYGTASRSEVWAFDTVGEIWTRKADLPEPREDFTAVTISGRIYAFGGKNSAAFSTNFITYDPNTDTWETIENIPDYARQYVKGVNYNDMIYIPGGGTSGTSNLATLLRIS